MTIETKGVIEPAFNANFVVHFDEKLKLSKDFVLKITPPFWVRGKFEPMSIIFTDLIGTSTVDTLLKTIKENDQSERILKIELFNRDGDIYRIWNITYTIVKISFGTGYDYTDHEQNKIELVIQPSTCDII